jgi:hypothetical protein
VRYVVKHVVVQVELCHIEVGRHSLCRAIIGLVGVAVCATVFRGVAKRHQRAVSAARVVTAADVCTSIQKSDVGQRSLQNAIVAIQRITRAAAINFSLTVLQQQFRNPLGSAIVLVILVVAQSHRGASTVATAARVASTDTASVDSARPSPHTLAAAAQSAPCQIGGGKGNCADDARG